MAKITIFGLAGVGTSSVGKILSAELNYKFLSSGDLFRGKARSLGLELNEFEKLCSSNDEYDRSLDEEIKIYGQQNDNFVIESRLAWFFVPDSVKIKIDCDFDVRISRIADRENLPFEKVKESTLEREKLSIDRYKRFYKIKDFAPDKDFDLLIDSTNISQNEISKMIVDFLNKNLLG